MSSAPKDPGAIRIRSNISFRDDDWNLVPGELVHEYRRREKTTRFQRKEYGYYLACSLCHRVAPEIGLDGCDRCPHAPRPEQVAGARQAQERQVAEARAQERKENEALLRIEE